MERLHRSRTSWTLGSLSGLARRMRCLFGSALLCVAAVAAAEEASTGLVIQYRSRQNLAQGMTEQLLAEIIDDQIQQMQDNHLTDLPLYQDLTDMRGRIEAISNEHMPRVLAVLAKAASADETQRRDLVLVAQSHMREILKRLIAERELVRARNQQAALIQRIGEVITSQRRAWQATRDATDADERQVLAALDAQATTRLLFHEFEETLGRVAGWPGDLGSVASEARRLLVTSKLDERLEEAVTRIDGLQLAQAAAVQQVILADLQRIEIEIHKLEDPAWIGDDLVRAVIELIHEQEQLRVASREVTPENVFTVLQQQSLVQEKLGRLVAKVGLNERAIMLATRAETNADAARQAIFENGLPIAIDHQGDVIGSLVELQTELKLRDGLFGGPKSAEEFFLLADRMRQMHQLLLQVRDTHGKAVTPFSADRAESRTAVKAASLLLKALKLDATEPPAVTRRIETATSFLEDIASGKAEITGQSLQFADHLIGYAVGEVDQAHRDAFRNAMAVKVGELNRAAESVSRAIGALRDEAYLLRTGMKRWGMGSFQEQLDITMEIGQKVARGTRLLAPNAVSTLATAILEMKRSMELQASDQSPDDQSLAAQVEKAALAMLAASTELRTEMIFSAAELESVVVAELDQVVRLLKDLNELAHLPELPEASVLADKGDLVMQQYTAIGAALHAAAHTRNSDPKQPGREIERARVLADIRRQELEELLEMIRELLAQAKRQQAAADELIDARNKVESGDKDEVNPREVAKAQEEFADSLTEIGQTASELANQPELANEPIREATELAASLTPQIPPPDSPSNDPSSQEPSSQDPSSQNPQPQNPQPQNPQPQNPQPQNPQPQNPQPQNPQPQNPQPQNPQPQNPQPQGLQPNSQPANPQPQDPQSGSQPEPPQPESPEPEGADAPEDGDEDPSDQPPGNMTPTDAMATAKLLSGTEATAMADQAREEQTGSGEGMIPPSGSPGDSPPESMAGEGPNQPSPGNAAMPPTPGTGERPQMPGPNTGLVSEQAAQGATNDPQAQLADSSHDASFQQDPNQRRPWSASLPPEIRDSMQSTSKQPLPTYYENQLKAYFQSFNP